MRIISFIVILTKQTCEKTAIHIFENATNIKDNSIFQHRNATHFYQNKPHQHIDNNKSLTMIAITRNKKHKTDKSNLLGRTINMYFYLIKQYRRIGSHNLLTMTMYTRDLITYMATHYKQNKDNHLLDKQRHNKTAIILQLKVCTNQYRWNSNKIVSHCNNLWRIIHHQYHQNKKQRYIISCAMPYK